MPGERDLGRLLADLRPPLRRGAYVFASVPDESRLAGAAVHASVREDEGLSVVLSREDADALGLPYDFVAAWITLGAASALRAVGLTAEVAARLARAGISANVIAGLSHDHLLVPLERGVEAVALLSGAPAAAPAP